MVSFLFQNLEVKVESIYLRPQSFLDAYNIEVWMKKEASVDCLFFTELYHPTSKEGVHGCSLPCVFTTAL